MRVGLSVADQYAVIDYHRPMWEALRGEAREGVEKAVPGFLQSLQMLFDQGYCLTDVGMMFGMSRERVRQFAKKYGLHRFPRTTPPRVWSWERREFVAIPSSRTQYDRAYKKARAIDRRAARWNEYQEDFWKLVEMSDGDSCWDWRGRHMEAGYGFFRQTPGAKNAAPLYAHRLAYTFVYGPPAGGLCILHHCDNPRCVNPQHLYAGTYKDNTRDAIERGRHIASPQRRPEMLLHAKLNGLKYHRNRRQKVSVR